VKRLAAPALTAACVAYALAMTACAPTVSGVDVQYPAGFAHRAMLASVSPRRIQLAGIADRRADPGRFGVNPGNGENLVTSRPVTEILRDALATELAKNGHAVVGDRPDLVLAAAVDEFWLDAVDGYSRTQYIGRVALALTVVDARSDRPLATREYVGIKRVEVDRKSDPPWRDVMNAALVRVMHDIATDQELVSAFAGASTADRADVSRARSSGERPATRLTSHLRVSSSAIIAGGSASSTDHSPSPSVARPKISRTGGMRTSESNSAISAAIPPQT
jgi:uncharacterized lipoprotein YajG